MLLTYRYRSESISWSTPKELLREIRVKALERQVLCRPAWARFAIWGAGRDGRAFFRCACLCFMLRVSFQVADSIFASRFPSCKCVIKLRSLTPENQAKVVYFLDISPKLIGSCYNYHGDGSQGTSHQILSEDEKIARQRSRKEQRRAMQGVKTGSVSLNSSSLPGSAAGGSGTSAAAAINAEAVSTVASNSTVDATNETRPPSAEVPNEATAAGATGCAVDDASKKRKQPTVDHRTVRAIPIIHFSECKVRNVQPIAFLFPHMAW